MQLSAAFDTIDDKLLLDRLEQWFGIRGDGLRVTSRIGVS